MIDTCVVLRYVVFLFFFFSFSVLGNSGIGWDVSFSLFFSPLCFLQGATCSPRNIELRLVSGFLIRCRVG